MDEKLRDVVAYLCDRYPHKDELSKARVAKMVYLADWRAAMTLGRQITSIDWMFNHFGPYVSDVVNVARRDPSFEVIAGENAFGSPRELIRLVQQVEPSSLTPEELAVLGFVIDATQGLYWTDFLSLVYSTYPVRTQPRYTYLDLPLLAKQYGEEQAATS